MSNIPVFQFVNWDECKIKFKIENANKSVGAATTENNNS